MEDKRGTTIRLTKKARDCLSHACCVSGKTKSQIVEEALGDYFEKHNFVTQYQLNLTKDRVVFQKVGAPNTIIEDTQRNGMPVEDIYISYQKRYQSPVLLVVQENEEES